MERVPGAVGEHHLERHVLATGAALAGATGETQIVHLADGRRDLDRINGGHRGQERRLPPTDEVALVDVEPPDDARDGRLDGGVVEIELRLRDGRAGRLDRGLRLLLRQVELPRQHLHALAVLGAGEHVVEWQHGFSSAGSRMSNSRSPNRARRLLRRRAYRGCDACASAVDRPCPGSAGVASQYAYSRNTGSIEPPQRV